MSCCESRCQLRVLTIPAVCVGSCMNRYLVIYISSIIRSVTALHDLLQNKIRFDEATTTGGAAAETKGSEKKDKEKEGKADAEKKSDKDTKKAGK